MPKEVYILLGIVFLLLVVGFIFYDDVVDFIVNLQGDRRLRRLIRRFASNNDYLVLSNVCVKVQDNQYGIIQYLLIADKYVYIIEGKNEFGSITGLGEDEKWILRKEDRQVHIVNPIKENRKLILGLAKQLNISNNFFVNICVYAKTALLDKIAFENPLEAVLEETDFQKYIKMMEKTAAVNDLNPESSETFLKKVAVISETNHKYKNRIQ